MLHRRMQFWYTLSNDYLFWELLEYKVNVVENIQEPYIGACRRKLTTCALFFTLKQLWSISMQKTPVILEPENQKFFILIFPHISCKYLRNTNTIFDQSISYKKQSYSETWMFYTSVFQLLGIKHVLYW